MRVLVTGGAGFIGSAVCRRLVLEHGASVVNVDKLTYASNLASLVSIERADLVSSGRLLGEDGLTPPGRPDSVPGARTAGCPRVSSSASRSKADTNSTAQAQTSSGNRRRIDCPCPTVKSRGEVINSANICVA